MRGLKRTGLLKFLLSASHPLRITLTLFTFIHSSLAAKKITILTKCLFQHCPRSSRLQTLCSTHFGTHFHEMGQHPLLRNIPRSKMHGRRKHLSIRTHGLHHRRWARNSNSRVSLLLGTRITGCPIPA